VLAAVEQLVVAAWVELRTGWDPASARIAVQAALRQQRYDVDPETGLYPDEEPPEVSGAGVPYPSQDTSWHEVVIENGVIVQGHARLAALVEEGSVEIVEHEITPKQKAQTIPRLLRHASTEQLLASRDEIQAKITAGDENTLGLASALRQVQVELGHRYLAHTKLLDSHQGAVHTREEYETRPATREEIEQAQGTGPVEGTS
jgi:hypothetical protein